MNDASIHLTLLEAYNRDVGRAVARIDYKSMEFLGASAGDILEITGKKRSVARCLPLCQTDEGHKTIRVDGMSRHNTGSEIGDTIAVRRIKTVPAEKITVKPLESIPPIDERYLADALENVPVTKNDNIMVPYFGGKLTFQIIGTEPHDDVVIDQKTIFTITNKSTRSAYVMSQFVYPTNHVDSEKLGKLKTDVEQYEKEISVKQEEIKHITRSMLGENRTVDDVKEFLNANSNESLISTLEQLLRAYRQYVAELEKIPRK
ncbi:MAG: hypothetical protein KGI27_00495 [Thaumarchaeota archaeon]|nr:hypothetical protein [Nitrososphaerota archaeon]